MTQGRQREFKLETTHLTLSAQEVPWDTDTYGTPVVQITEIKVLDKENALTDYSPFRTWIEVEQAGIIGARLAHTQLTESMFLETQGFRFVEMVLHPWFVDLQSQCFPSDHLVIGQADEAELNALQSIAERAFGFERYHIDPRLSPRLGDIRYGRWVRNSLHHQSQQLLKVRDGDRLIALFLIEMGKNRSVYWHLTAIAPEWQRQGYGRRVWLAMLDYCKSQGAETVSTTISARNTPVLNLYSQLQFRFAPPEMTFHWIRGKE